MNKEERIKRYGEEAWQKRLERKRVLYKANPERVNAYNRKYREEHPEKAIANSQEQCQKGGKYYDKKLEDQRTGIPGEKQKIRTKHAREYKQYKDIVAPDSQLHHEWIGDTAEYRGLALVEKEQHMHGIVDVIQILDGEITLLTEEEVRRGKRN